MKVTRVLIIALLMLATGYSSLSAQQTGQKFVIETDYLLYLPDNYVADTAVKLPLVMFLHGAGETGNDLEMLKAHGLPRLINEGKKFPFIVVSPQARKYGWNADILYSLLQDVFRKYRVDEERVYLTGLSMGGFGTWDLAAKYPRTFAAIIPICGGGDTSTVWQLDKTPVWCFHGAKDNVVPLSSSERMVDALRKYNPDVKFTVYPDASHDSWTATYANDSIYSWLLAHQQFSYKQVPIAEALLKEYSGEYASSDNNVFDVVVDGNVLQVQNDGKKMVVLQPASEVVFFIYEKLRDYVMFERDAKGAVTGLTVHNGKQTTFFKKTK